MIENEDLKKINELMHLALTEGAISEEECLDDISQIVKYRSKVIKGRSKLWDGLRKMPPLHHKLPDETFDLEKSDVLNWIGKDKQAIGWVMRSAAKNGYISYDKTTGKWSGVEHD